MIATKNVFIIVMLFTLVAACLMFSGFFILGDYHFLWF